MEKFKFKGAHKANSFFAKKSDFKVGYKKYQFPRTIIKDDITYIYDRKVFEGQQWKYYYRNEKEYYSQHIVLW